MNDQLVLTTPINKCVTTPFSLGSRKPNLYYNIPWAIAIVEIKLTNEQDNE
ncbi:MAG: hypothetical protein AB4352_24390 [Hormoscilla sp.]